MNAEVATLAHLAMQARMPYLPSHSFGKCSVLRGMLGETMGTILQGGALVKLQGPHQKTSKIKGKPTETKTGENIGKPRRGGSCNFTLAAP